MLEDKITKNLSEAMKSGDKLKVSVMRLLISEMKNKKIEEGVKELKDEQVLGLIQKMVKRHKESIEKFAEGNRQDLVEKEESEMAVLEGYMPEQISIEELGGIIDESIKKTGAGSMKDMGKVMSDVMPKVQGRADGKEINRLVREKLS